MSAHAIQWVTPAPLWPATLDGGRNAATEGQRMRAPALLRFERDSFMDDLSRELAADPAGLGDHIATKVSYRLPAPGAEEPPPPAELKLYQAAHGHFHLVAASLTCRLPGLPDHDVDAGRRERVAFVLRRHDDDGEWAWADDPETPGGRAWSPIAPAATGLVAAGEELLPLFPVAYADGERRRRIFVGLVPTSSGDTFKAAGALSPVPAAEDGGGGPAPDPRPQALRTKVTDPLRALAAAPTDAPDSVTDPARRQAIRAAEIDQLVQASRFLLVDFAELLVTALPEVWTALRQAARPAGAGAGALYDALAVRRADPQAATTWREALVAAWDTRLVLFGDASGSLPAPLNLAGSPLSGDELDALVAVALPPPPAGDATGAPASIQGDVVPPQPVPKLDPQGRWRYRIRCVYRRPQCPPAQADVVSEPTAHFRIAGFFDLDAPVRPINIALPLDTGTGDLRKLRKNVSFLLSNQLRAQMNRVTNLNDALKGQFADGESFDLGLICSFSLPIISICALLVLMIFVQLLNIVFWWLPFLRICFPAALRGGGAP